MTFHGALFDGKLSPTAQDTRQLIAGLLDDIAGVFNGPNSNYGGLKCSAGSGMNTSITTGRASVLNSYASVQGGLWVVRNDASASALHGANSSGNPRWDSVGVRVYDSETGGDSSDIVSPIVVAGNPSASAAIGTGTTRWSLGTANLTGAPGQSGGPSLPNNYLQLALVLVPNGAASSASFSYLDWRLFITGGQRDSGWVPLTFPANSAAAAGFYAPAARLDGNMVKLRGTLTTSTTFGAATPLADVPAGMAPASSIGMVGSKNASGSGIQGVLYVTTTGHLQFGLSMVSSDYLSIDNSEYSLS